MRAKDILINHMTKIAMVVPFLVSLYDNGLCYVISYE